ncbi:protein phosphatase inhibitor 2-like [Apis cerana]|nr:protein phosphatase inhibitor 2-like [Apis cerana]
MAENLSKRPPKGILKSSSFDKPDLPRSNKETKWDEMNIIATLHPPGKDYGHIKIDEPKTPYSYEGLPGEFEFDELDSATIAAKLAESSKPKIFEESSEDEEETETLEEREKRKAFEAKRKRHYQEWQVVQMARKQLLEQDEEDEDEDKEDNEENEEGTQKDDNICLPSEEQINFNVKFKCMSSCNVKKGK